MYITPATSAPTGSIGSMVVTDGRIIFLPVETGHRRIRRRPSRIFCRLNATEPSLRTVEVRFNRYFSAGWVLTIEGGWAHSDGNMFLTGIGRTQILGSQRPWIRSSLRIPKGQLSAV